MNSKPNFTMEVEDYTLLYVEIIIHSIMIGVHMGKYFLKKIFK